MDIRLPIPSNWQDFESICHRLWSEIWNDPNAQKNGRAGQSQNGVDIIGVPIYSKEYAGVQCKDKDRSLGSALKKQELLAECNKAKKFSPSLSSFTLATTSPRDAALQEIARNLTYDKLFPFNVQIWAWDDIQSEIIYRPSIYDIYYPKFELFNEYPAVGTFNRLSSLEKMQAYFSRPAVANIISKQLKSVVISLAYELSDNAYVYGKATDFRISVENKKIIFIDNGKQFNPLIGLNARLTTSANNIGSFVLDGFIKQFDGLVQLEYFRKKNNGVELNILEINILDEMCVLNQNDFIELYVDWKLAAGREAARNLALSLPITMDIKDVIWTITDSYAMSFFSEMILLVLDRLNSVQRLIISLPRDYMYRDIEKWFNDDRLLIQRR